MIMEMDKWLRYYAALAREKFPKADLNEPGTGAAGGLGFAFLTFTNAVLESGIKIVLEETKLESFVKDADVVVTGEGRLDFQTAMGKAPVGVAKLAKKFDIPVLAFAGSVTKDATECNKNGHRCLLPNPSRHFNTGRSHENGKCQTELDRHSRAGISPFQYLPSGLNLLITQRFYGGYDGKNGFGCDSHRGET